jgi:apolipoprotein N-acyltransferase
LGAVGIFAYSPFDYWLVVFLSAFGLVGAATLPNKKMALWATFAWSLGYFGVGVNWVQVSMTQFGGVPDFVSYLIVLGLAAYLALYNLLFTWISQRFSLKNPFALAGLFTFTEYLRGVVFTGFPWLQFGYSLIDSPFAGLAPLLGVEGLTFLVISTSVMLVALLRFFAEKRVFPTAYIALGVSALVFSWASGWLNFVEKDQGKAPLKVSLVQGNIAQKMKWDPEHFEQTIRTYDELLAPLYGKRDVIILPESAIAAAEESLEGLFKYWHNNALNSQSEIIVGSLYRNLNDELYNSAVLLGSPDQPYELHESPRYRKHHLVPFGEYVPFGNLLGWLREVFILPINLSQGTFIQSPMWAKSRKFNLAVCYEIIFGDQVQRNQQADPSDYLLTITNDAWFGESVGPWQHFQIARMRALELGKPLLRAANTGITAAVDEKGKILAQLPQFEAAVLDIDIQPSKGKTPFSEYGHWLIYLISLLSLALSMRVRKA